MSADGSVRDLVEGAVAALVFLVGLVLGRWRWKERGAGDPNDNGLD